MELWDVKINVNDAVSFPLLSLKALLLPAEGAGICSGIIHDQNHHELVKNSCPLFPDLTIS